MKPVPPWLAAVLVFLSSGAVLVLEIVGLRLIGPYVGVTLQSSSAVIGVALGAIATGAWTGGRLADRSDARTLLPPCLLLAGLSTGLTLPVVRYAGELLRGTNPASIVGLTVLTLFVPSALLSAITPLIIKLELRDLRETGRVVGRLSSIGTLGAIMATLVTGFVLVAALPTSTIVVSMAVLLAIIGLFLGIYIGRPGGVGARGILLGLGALLASGAAPFAPNPCHMETAYHCARIVPDPMRPSGRFLWLNSAQHSYLDLLRPHHLQYAYAQWIGVLMDVMAPPDAPLDMLLMGGGGFTLPAYLSTTRPSSHSLVFEIDEGLIQLSRAELGLTVGPNLAVLAGDARIHLREQAADTRDLVIGDAFSHLGIPWHLTTRELVEDVRRVLRPNGIYAQNIIDWPPARFVRAELATIRAVFRHIILVAPPSALTGAMSGNFVVIASDLPLPVPEIKRRLGLLHEPVWMLSGDEVERFTGEARVLTDDFAPVDQLRVRSQLARVL